jgi:hypothetical protein
VSLSSRKRLWSEPSKHAQSVGFENFVASFFDPLR